jgi:hypothetical protein
MKKIWSKKTRDTVPLTHWLILIVSIASREIRRLSTTPFSLVLRREYFDCPQRDSYAVHYIYSMGRGSLYSCTLCLVTVTSCIDASVRIVTKSPKVGPLLIYSPSLWLRRYQNYRFIVSLFVFLLAKIVISRMRPYPYLAVLSHPSTCDVLLNGWYGYFCLGCSLQLEPDEPEQFDRQPDRRVLRLLPRHGGCQRWRPGRYYNR